MTDARTTFLKSFLCVLLTEFSPGSINGARLTAAHRISDFLFQKKIQKKMKTIPFLLGFR